MVTDFDVKMQYQNKQHRQFYQFARADWESLNEDFNTLSNKESYRKKLDKLQIYLKKTCRRSMRKAEWEYINNTITQGLQTNNSKPVWKYIKSGKQDNIGVAPLKRMVHWCVTAMRRLRYSWTSSRVSSPEMVDLLPHTLTIHNTQ